MIDDDQDAVGNSHDCFLRGLVGVRAGDIVSRGSCLSYERWPRRLLPAGRAEGVAFGWFPAQTLSSTLLVARVHAGPGGNVFIGGEAAARFLAWYEREEQASLQLSALTPIAIIGYSNDLQHEQHKSISTINLQVSAMRAWCGWLTEQGYLAADPSADVKLVGGETSSSRKGLKSAQVNALLLQAQNSRNRERNYAIVQVLLQTGIRLSECAVLTFEDITFGERSGLLRVRAGKGNKARSVPVNASAREAIAAYVAPRLGIEKPSVKAVTKGWPKPKSPEAHEPIFLSQKGERSRPQPWGR